jgi:hypothetical protein
MQITKCSCWINGKLNTEVRACIKRATGGEQNTFSMVSSGLFPDLIAHVGRFYRFMNFCSVSEFRIESVVEGILFGLFFIQFTKKNKAGGYTSDFCC